MGKGKKGGEQERAKKRAATRAHAWRDLQSRWPMLSRMAASIRVVDDGRHAPTDGWAYICGTGELVLNPYQEGDFHEWQWVFAHLLLHLGLGHPRDLLAEDGLSTELADNAVPDAALATAGCVVAHRFGEIAKAGRALRKLPVLPNDDELRLTERWRDAGIPAELRSLGVAGSLPCFRRRLPGPGPVVDLSGSWTRGSSYRDIFAAGLAEVTREAMSQAAEKRGVGIPARRGPWDKALGWFVSAYPLLGGLAAGMEIVADTELTRAWDITVAAVSAEAGEIYINPQARLDEEEWRFVLAHEMLHAALRHDLRLEGRDPYLFNVSADFVINGWLVEMGVGAMPEDLLYDPDLAGLSAESVYDTLVTDLRRARKLATPGARGVGDILGPWMSEPQAAARRSSRRTKDPAAPWDRAAWGRSEHVGAVDLDAFYRRALSSGMSYHDESRGLLPAGLVEEIRALEHPPLSWDAKLARWFEEHVPVAEPLRSYARASRRQASTPDIARPGRVRPERLERRATFGVVLDTSGSMEPALLGKALGAIASYASARDVPAARVVFCDAAAYDAGYLAPEEIAGRVRIRGRGGTVLQPGVGLLERAPDFPADGPILIITDAQCDVVRVRREHAYLVPAGARLPFTPRGPVFHVR